MHTLFFTQALYSTGQLYIQLIPVLFFIGWILINYSFVIKIWKIENKALFSVLLFLVIPFTFYIINFWAYYQEIFIGFFYSATILCLFNIRTDFCGPVLNLQETGQFEFVDPGHDVVAVVVNQSDAAKIHRYKNHY